MAPCLDHKRPAAGTFAVPAHCCGTINPSSSRNGMNAMVETVVVEPPSAAVSGVSWAAVAAGAVVPCALTLVLLAFVVGLGLSVVSVWTGAGVSTATFKIRTGLYLIVIAMLSSSIGGYIAGRLRAHWVGVHSDEVYFRDTAHGLVSWALASVIGVILLATSAASLVGGGIGAAGQGAAASASRSGPMDSSVDALLRPASPPAQPQGSAKDPRDEMLRLFTSSFRTGGEVKASDREYISKVVATRTGLSQPAADKRVNDVIAQIKVDMDAAPKATAQLAFWLSAPLLLGAFGASLAATEGGGLRDGTWSSRKLSPAMQT